MLPYGHPVEQGLAKCASGKFFWAPVGLLKRKEMKRKEKKRLSGTKVGIAIKVVFCPWRLFYYSRNGRAQKQGLRDLEDL